MIRVQSIDHVEYTAVNTMQAVKICLFYLLWGGVNESLNIRFLRN